MAFNPKHIVVPVAIDAENDMALAEHAVYAACDLAVKFSSKITILHLLPALKPGGAASIDFTGSVYESFKKVLEARLAEGRRKVQDLEKSVNKRGIEVDARVMESLDDTSKVILEASEDLGADLLVVGSHGYQGLSRALFGSVSEKIIKNTSIPVLLLHAPSPQTDLP